jgi:hypothetical protein
MRVILSRKGFDSSAVGGGGPSPILPTGKYCSLPIPEKDLRNPNAPRYEEVSFDGASLGPLVQQLTHGRVAPDRLAHLDPDLQRDSLPRKPGWRGVFGQASSAEAHLTNRGVDAGDLFLFFGWFKPVVVDEAGLRYQKGDSGFHAIFGWLQVSEKIPFDRRWSLPEWARMHPHNKDSPYSPRESFYLAEEVLRLPGSGIELLGAGVFSEFRQNLRSTAPGESRRSYWSLPKWFYPKGRASVLSYNGELSRWSLACPGPESVMLRTLRGQEYVLDLDDYPEGHGWLESLFREP